MVLQLVTARTGTLEFVLLTAVLVCLSHLHTLSAEGLQGVSTEGQEEKEEPCI